MRIFLLLLVTWSSLALAQTPAPKVVSEHSEQRAVTATKTGLNYELLISLPENYAATQDRYPVLLVLDGWHFPLMHFMQNNNRFSRRMPPVIIVTISHGSGNVMPARARDFTPTCCFIRRRGCLPGLPRAATDPVHRPVPRGVAETRAGDRAAKVAATRAGCVQEHHARDDGATGFSRTLFNCASTRVGQHALLLNAIHAAPTSLHLLKGLIHAT